MSGFASTSLCEGGGCPANGVEAQFSLGTLLGREEGLEPSGSAPMDITGHTARATPAVDSGWAQRRGGARKLQFLHPGHPRPGRGVGVKGGELFLHSMEKVVEGSTNSGSGGPLARKTLPEPGARGPGFERGGLAPPAGLHGAEGPSRGELVGEEGPAAAAAAGGCREAVFRCRGGSEEGPGPSVSSAGPRPGVLCPLGGGTVSAPSVCQSGHVGSCWPSPPIRVLEVP